jgi:hypothetical protein
MRGKGRKIPLPLGQEKREEIYPQAMPLKIT